MIKKILILFFVISLLPVYSYAEENTTFIYCEIVGVQKFLSTKMNILVDYGQEANGDGKILRGEDGKPVIFNSMVDAMNMLGTQGWEFVQAYVVTFQSQNIYHWLLKYNTTGMTQEEIVKLKEVLKTSKK